MIRKGDLYLADLSGKVEHNIGKKRPVIVFQNDFLNRAVLEETYRDLIVIPLSTQIIPSSYRLPLPPRAKLEKESDAVCLALCSIDVNTLDLQTGLLGRLTLEEIHTVEGILRSIFGMER